MDAGAAIAPDERQNSLYLPLRVGKQQVAPDVAGLPAAPRECRDAGRVDELKP